MVIYLCYLHGIFQIFTIQKHLTSSEFKKGKSHIEINSWTSIEIYFVKETPKRDKKLTIMF